MANLPEIKNQPEKNPKTKKPVQVSRIFGYGFIIFGILSIIDFFSPIPIPTAGESAILTGLLCVAFGAFLLARNKLAWFKKVLSRLRFNSKPRMEIDPLVPVKILKLARERRGILTQAEVAVELTLSLAEAEAGLQECVRAGQAAADFDMEKEIKYYRFQEFVPSPEPSAAPADPF